MYFMDYIEKIKSSFKINNDLGFIILLDTVYICTTLSNIYNNILLIQCL